jgi:site-specific recombinase XerD
LGDVVTLAHVPKTRQSATRKTNEEVRPREYLEREEVQMLVRAAAKVGRHPLRDSTMILMADRHGYRAEELCRLKWIMVEFHPRDSKLSVYRLKGSDDSKQFLSRDEVIRLKKLKTMPKYAGQYVFAQERGDRLTPGAFWKIVKRAGEVAGFSFPLHPHMLRHACGYRLTNEGRDTRSVQAFMGHRKPKNAEIYTRMSPDRFRDF